MPRIGVFPNFGTVRQTSSFRTRSREEKLEKTELVLMITPRVVGTAVDAARITEEMRRITPELEKSLRRAPRQPTPTPPPPSPTGQ